MIGGLVALYFSIAIRSDAAAAVARFSLAAVITTGSSFTILWIEIGVNSLSFTMVGLTLVLYGVALALSDVYPRWLAGWP